MGDNEKKTIYRKLRNEKLQSDLLDWWKKLQINKGNRAQLRRCTTPAEAAMHAETHALMKILPRWVSYEAVATICGILAHIKQIGTGTFGQKLAMQENGKVLFSELRFRQFLSCKEWNEFYTALRRAITMLNGNANPLAVIDVILHWDEEYKGTKYSEPSKSLKFTLSKDYYSQILK